MKNNLYKIATPISNLFNNKKNADLIHAFSDCLECRDQSFNSKLSDQELFHCELQPIHFFDYKKIKYLESIKISKPNLKLISFHLASCYDQPKIKKGVFVPNGNKLSEKQLFNNAKKNLMLIRKIFGNKIIVAVENNNHYNTKAYDYITNPSFIQKIVNDNKIRFLFDTAHAKISAYNLDMKLDDYMSKLPLDKLIQIHISKPGFDEKGKIFDKHDLPTKKELVEAIYLIRKFPKTRYLTIEYYKNTLKLINLSKQLREMLNENYG